MFSTPSGMTKEKMLQPSFARWLFLGAGVCAVGALLLSAGASATAAAQAPGVVDAT